MNSIRAIASRYGWIGVGVGLLASVYLLPPDTSLAEVHRAGQITACVPPSRPPLVTGKSAEPGIEVELLQQIATEIGVPLSLNVIPAMGQDFNPRSWRITRAQCAVIGGGLIDSLETRAFLSPGPAYSQSGWTALLPAGVPALDGRTVGVLATQQGGDRVALSSYLRSIGARPVLARNTAALSSGIDSGRFGAGVADATIATPLAAAEGWTAVPLPPPLGSHTLILGLWKGDLTLKRAIEAAFNRIRSDGRLAGILSRYSAR